jgi:SAM-dependent methyltransferase
LLLIEPDQKNVGELKRRFGEDPRVQIKLGYLEDLDRSFATDTIVAVNVLEHVERPEAFLRAAHRILAPGGALLLLVPALPALYSSLDRAFDHYRRYTRPELREALVSARFSVDTLYYLNSVGVLAWFTAGHVLRRTTLGPRQVRFYDRLVIPWLRRLESLAHPPLGQSLLAIARKPETTSRRRKS